MHLVSRQFSSLLKALVFFLIATQAQGAFNIDFRNATWTSTQGTTTGWPLAGSATPASPTTASTVLDGATGLSLTVTSSFVGTASTGPNNLKLDPPNTAGFAFQNKGTGDLNPGNSLLNYQRIDFSFSNSIVLDNLQLEDIDRSSTAVNPQWIDATTIQLWNGSPTAFGAGINPDIALAGTTNLSIVNAATSRFGVPWVYANTGGNTINNDVRSIAYFSSAAEVDGFSIFFWNQRNATGGQHGIALRASGSEVVAVPEPSQFAILSGILVLTFCLLRRMGRQRA